MGRFYINDGAVPGRRIPQNEHREQGSAGSDVLNEAQAIARGRKLTATEYVIVGPKVTFHPITVSGLPQNTQRRAGISNDGRIVVAYPSGYAPRVSADNGVTWAIRNIAGFADPRVICLSADGQKQWIACNGRSFVSSDFGVTWTMRGDGFGDIFSYSDDLQIGFATYASYGTRRLMNDGVNWNLYGSTINPINHLTMSRNGRYMHFTGGPANTQYITGDYGATWVERAAVTGRCIFSDDGVLTRHLATQVFTSTDLGATWSGPFTATNAIVANNISLACSADGTYHVRGGTATVDGQVSRDHGQTWETMPGIRLNSVSMSANGKRIIGISAVAPYETVINDI